MNVRRRKGKDRRTLMRIEESVGSHGCRCWLYKYTMLIMTAARPHLPTVGGAVEVYDLGLLSLGRLLLRQCKAFMPKHQTASCTDALSSSGVLLAVESSRPN